MLLYNNIMANANSDGIIIPNYVNNAQVVQTRWENLLSSVATQPTTGGGDAIRRAAYDTSRLSKVGTDPEAARQQQQQQQEEQQEQQLQRQSDIDQQNANNDVSGAEGKEDDSGFILTMVLNIVPTGVRITNKLPVLVEGMKNVALSIIDMISNLSILSIILFADTFTFVTQSFYFIFTMLLCMVFNLTNLHKCIVFYLFDLFLLVIFMSVMSALFMIDVFFGTKTYIGVSCVEALMMIIGSFGDIDAAIYGFTGVHIFSYPDFILNLCYRCEMAGDLSGFYRASGKMGYDLGVLVPTSIGGPIGEFIGGIIDMVSIFSING
jgi:hypothetical protein